MFSVCIAYELLVTYQTCGGILDSAWSCSYCHIIDAVQSMYVGTLYIAKYSII